MRHVVPHPQHQTPKQPPYLPYTQNHSTTPSRDRPLTQLDGDARPRDALKPSRLLTDKRFFSTTSKWAARTALSRANAHIDNVT